MEPLFLSLAEVLLIHRDQIDLYGGEPGLRDLGLLQSALAMPSAGFGEKFFHQDLFEMAAAYLYHIALDHPFVDGNKRCAFVAAYVFLRMNDIVLTLTDAQIERMSFETAQGKLRKQDIAALLKRHSKLLHS